MHHKFAMMITTFEHAPAQGTFWASAEDLRSASILYSAICAVHNKLRLKAMDNDRSLAGSYSNRKPGDNGKLLDALMNLPGKFTVASGSECDVMKEGKKIGESYGCAHAEGITFNKNLVAKSFCWTLSNKDWIDIFSAYAYFALLQQTVEHELGHLMSHHYVLDNAMFDIVTPNKMPLSGESGFHVQEMAQRRAAKSDTTKRNYKALLLECESGTFDSPLEGHMFFSNVLDSVTTRPNHDKIVKPSTLEELQEYMKLYPRFEFQPTVSSTLMHKRKAGKEGIKTP